MILSICDSSSALEVIRIIKVLIQIICIVVPIILLVSTMLSFVKDVKDGKSDGLKSFAIKGISAILIFFIPTLVGVIANIASNDGEYKDCIALATSEGIQAARAKEVILLVDAAIKTMNKSDYLIAEAEVNKLEDGAGKQEAISKLNELKSLIELKDEVYAAVKSGGEADYKKLLADVNALESGELKSALLEQLKKMRDRLDNKGLANVDAALRSITSKLKVINKNLYLGEYDASGGSFAFWLYVPDNLKSNSSLVVYLHDLGCRGNDYQNASDMAVWGGPIAELRKGTKSWKNAVFIHPQVPTGSTAQKYSRPFNELIDKVSSSLRTKKTSVMGFSNGCYGVFAMANDFQGKYSAVVPVGCNPTGNANVFSSTAYWSFVGSGEGTSSMPGFASQVSSVNGGKAKHTATGHNDHNVMYDEDGYSIITSYDVVEWMIRQ